MKTVSGLKYSKEHEWIKSDGNKAYIGITDFAQHSLGQIVFAELPEIGADLNIGDVVGVVESVKAASDIFTPISGKVVEINEELLDNPGKINEEPFESWIAVLEISNASELEGLMDETEYEKFCIEEE
jgi:glycine cleavage system H protein